VAPLDEPESLSETDRESRQTSLEVLRAAVKVVQDRSDEKTWQAFWRTAIDGLNATDIANELEMNPDAVRQAKFQVTRRLREEVGPLLDEILRDAGVALEE